VDIPFRFPRDSVKIGNGGQRRGGIALIWQLCSAVIGLGALTVNLRQSTSRSHRDCNRVNFGFVINPPGGTGRECSMGKRSRGERALPIAVRVRSRASNARDGKGMQPTGARGCICKGLTRLSGSVPGNLSTRFVRILFNQVSREL